MTYLFPAIPSLSESRMKFQDAVTPIAEGITNLHNDIMFFIMFILGFVFVFLGVTYFNNRVHLNSRPSANTHGTLIEIIWTVTPTLILAVIAFPTFALIYSLDEGIPSDLTLKAIGNQWFWHYEYSDFINKVGDASIAFDSYPAADADLGFDQFRLLTTDHFVALPIDKHIRILITATDVLHCWTVPSFGVKMDAVPGRLNQSFVYINNIGVFHGQCSEICGANHAFMPIEVHAMTPSNFISWASSMIEAN